MWLHQTVQDDNGTLLRYLIAEDKPDFDLLDDHDDEMDTVVAVMDAKSSYYRSINVR
jgi:hypothetical protein